jgi:GDP-D-mannose dehydratase
MTDSKGKRALITEITGQDGSCLAELLSQKGDEAHGVVERLSTSNTTHILNIFDNTHLVDMDLHDQGTMDYAIRVSAPILGHVKHASALT